MSIQMQPRSLQLPLALLCSFLAAAPGLSVLPASVPIEVREAIRHKKRNVLLIYVDDLKVKTQADSLVQLPGQDFLRAHGVSFTKAHASFAECGPSRTALMTSLRPDMTHVWGNKDPMRDFMSDLVTLPQWFKENGYETQSIGKVFHNGCGEDAGVSWSVNMSRIEYKKEHDTAWAAIPPSVPDDDPLLPDGKIGILANESLARLSSGTRPWFLAVGFKKPHLPFVFPERFLELYPEEAFNHSVEDEAPPEGAPEIADFDWKSTLSNFKDMAVHCEGDTACLSRGPPIPPEVARALRRAYYASASWSDSLVDGLLRQLRVLHQYPKTVIVYVSDHGWKLGRYNEWAKQTLWNVDVRTPLIISAPEMHRNATEIDVPIEHIDVAPTLAELCGLTVPPDWQGKSWASYLWGSSPTPPKSWAIGQQHRINNEGDSAMGSSITTRNWKYIEWPRWSTGETGCKYRYWEQRFGRELYRLEEGYDPYEEVNVVGNPEYQAVVNRLSGVLRKQFNRVPCTTDDARRMFQIKDTFFADQELSQLDDELRSLLPPPTSTAVMSNITATSSMPYATPESSAADSELLKDAEAYRKIYKHRVLDSLESEMEDLEGMASANGGEDESQAAFSLRPHGKKPGKKHVRNISKKTKLRFDDLVRSALEEFNAVPNLV